MDEKDDKHFCIVCNQTIYGLMNYVDHRKKFCTAEIASSGPVGLVSSVATSGDFEENNTTGKIIFSLQKDTSDFLETISVNQTAGQTVAYNLTQFSEARTPSNNIVQTSLNEHDGSSLQLIYDGQNYVPINRQNCVTIQTKPVDEASETETYLVIKPDETEWMDSSINDEEVVLTTQMVPCNEVPLCKAMSSVPSFKEKIDTDLRGTKHRNTNKSEFGLLSVTVDGEKKSSKKKRKRRHLSVRLDGTYKSDPIKSKKRNSKKRKISSEYSKWEDDKRDDSVIENENKVGSEQSIYDGNNYIKVKVEDNSDTEIEQEANDSDFEDLRNDNVINDDKLKDKTSVISEKIHLCSICEENFKSQHYLVQHLLTKEHKKMAEIKGEREEYFRLIENYQKAIVQQSPFRCDICLFYFNHHEHLLEHIASNDHCVQVRGHRDIVCSVCNFSAQSNKLLMLHFQSTEHCCKLDQENMVCVVTFSRKKNNPKFRNFSVGKSNSSDKLKTTTKFVDDEHTPLKVKCGMELSSTKIPTDEKGEANIELLIKIDTKPEVGLSDDLVKEEEDVINTEPDDKDEVNKTSEEKNGMASNKAKLSHDIDSQIFTGVNLESGNELNVDSNSLSRNFAASRQYVDKLDLSEGSEQSAVRCRYCSFQTYDYHELKPHYANQHGIVAKTCDSCGLIFPSGKGYSSHVNSKNHQANIKKSGSIKEGLFECHVCKKKFDSENYCKFHTAYFHFHKTTEEEVLKETENGDTRLKFGEYLDAIKGLPPGQLLNCPECDANIKKNNMLHHLRKHTGERPFVCNICTEGFYCSASLRRHLVVHFDCFDRTCEICGKQCKGQYSYKIHIGIHEAKNNNMQKANICHICGEGFYIKKQLQFHMKKHVSKDYKCDEPGCMWAFSFSHDLKRHKLSHLDAKPFICATCGYATKSQKYLLSHEKIHKQENLLKCEHCTYQTMKKTHLRRHMRIHLGTKPFKCPYCAYTCNTHDNIRKHILETALHKGLKVYPCRFCQYSTNLTKEIRNHVVAYHSEQININEVKGGSLAAFTGLFNKAEDVQVVTESTQIFPVKPKKVSQSKMCAELNSAVKMLPQ